MENNNMLAMILAGGRGSRLYGLTNKTAKPAVFFGGKYRIIDFPLSNCANSNVNVVGVLTQYEPVQLNAYAGAGQRWGLDARGSGVYVLPPSQRDGANFDMCLSFPVTISTKWTTTKCSTPIKIWMQTLPLQ